MAGMSGIYECDLWIKKGAEQTEMERILRVYGRGLIEAAALVLFLLLLFNGIRDEKGNVGIFSVLGGALKEETMAEGTDFFVCIAESRRAVPQIFYKKSEALQTGTYALQEVIGATDCEGKVLLPQLKEICAPSGQWQTCVAKTDWINFSQAGIYTLRLIVKDGWNQMGRYEICIPVHP